MSDLASSCEYHTIEKTCLAVCESPKAQANRQQRCLNDEKTACCYICDSRQECAISCKFLGAVDNKSAPQAELQKPEPQTPINPPKAPTSEAPKTIPTNYCPSCNVEMTPKKAKLHIEGWDSDEMKQYGDNIPFTQDTLPVIVYLCPCCGKIEFKAHKN